jgi:hypothetical protein
VRPRLGTLGLPLFVIQRSSLEGARTAVAAAAGDPRASSADRRGPSASVDECNAAADRSEQAQERRDANLVVARKTLEQEYARARAASARTGPSRATRAPSRR